MKVIITGGTGLIGRALAHSLIKDGHQVVVLTRNPKKKVDGLPGVRLVKWNGKSGDGWYKELERADAIVNMAGESIAPQAGRWNAERKKRIKQSRIDASKAVVDAISRVSEKPDVLIQGSAVGFYGTHDDQLITEVAPAGNDFLAEVVKEWEMASQPVEAMGVRRVLARTGVVLAAEGGSLPVLTLPFKLFVGGPVGSGRQYMPWIHLEDQVNALRFLIENNEIDGPVNLTAPNPVTNKEFGQVMGQVLGRPSFFPTPGFMIQLLLGEASTLALDGQRAVPHALQKAGYNFKYTDLKSALSDLLK